MKEICFYKTEDAFGCFSNFSSHAIFLHDKIWRTTEHFFQAQKFNELELRERIRLIKKASDAAIEGRRRDLPLRLDWEAIKNDVMRQAIFAKFTQHPDLKATLLSTGDLTLIEHTENDSYWADGGDGSGKNMLGIILMEVREKLRGSTSIS